MGRLEEAIKGLGKKQRKMGDYIIQNYRRVAFMSAQELARELNVSPSTIVRLAQKLGYQGYPGLQDELRRLIEMQISPMRQLRQSVDEFTSEEDVISDVLSEDIDAIQRTRTEFLKKSFLEAVDALSKARRIYIIGLRSSYCLAYYFWFLLSQFLNNVQCIQSGTDDIFDRILGIARGDVLFAIGFPRYTRRTLQVVSYAKDKGVTVIALTDGPASPLAAAADIQLLVSNPRNVYSFVAPMSVLNALIVALGARFKEEVHRGLSEREKTLIETGIYY
ncbi:MAG TPA: MurR/RpiR family transcriptional regulator [Firmicutes bacterium]|nr:MurR/RpiR family transcriptional regulator [Bacillota bacterium]